MEQENKYTFDEPCVFSNEKTQANSQEKTKVFSYEELSDILGQYYEKEQLDFILSIVLCDTDKSQEVLTYCLQRIEKLKELKTLRILKKIEKLSENI
jgi:hypothetical protein